MRIALKSTWHRLGRGLLGGITLTGMICIAGGASADVQRFESVGAIPISLDAPGTTAPRDAAIERAILEAVERVAKDLLDAEAERQRLLASTLPPDYPEAVDIPDRDPLDPTQSRPDEVEPSNGVRPPNGVKPPNEVKPPDFSAILGRKMALYASRYRVLEDRGEGPAIFSSEPDVTTEYVVIVEVFVDTDRVRRRLVKAGVLPAGQSSVAVGQVRLEIEGLDAYPGYLALQQLLEQELGAISVIPIEIQRGRMILEVETADEPMILLEKLLAQMSPEIEIVPLVPDGSDLRLAVHWTPLLPEPDEEFSPVASGRDDPWSADSDASEGLDPAQGRESDARRPQSGSGN